MKFNRFEEIVAWQKAREIVCQIYNLTSKVKDYSFNDQIRRAAISIGNNIAEGFERKSNQEFKYFLFVSKGSAGEVRSMLYLAKDLKYFCESECENLMAEVTGVSRMISGLIKTL
jgi:four helix bundle protein